MAPQSGMMCPEKGFKRNRRNLELKFEIRVSIQFSKSLNSILEVTLISVCLVCYQRAMRLINGDFFFVIVFDL